MAVTAKQTASFMKKLTERFGDDYELLSEYQGTANQATFKHKCGHVWTTQAKSVLYAKGNGCPECKRKSMTLTQDEFKEKLTTVYGGTFTLSKGAVYVNARTSTWFHHSICDKDFEAEPYVLLKQGSCHHCRGNLTGGTKKTTEQFAKELLELRNGQFVLSDGAEYITALDNIDVIHVSCGKEFPVRASHILYNSGCPICKESKGEAKVKDALDSLNVVYQREVKFEGCRNKRMLPFDFAVYDSEGCLKGLIEYDGSQHFISFKHFGGDDKLKRTQCNDAIKNRYCEENSIPLLRIPYTTTDLELKNAVYSFIQEK